MTVVNSSILIRKPIKDVFSYSASPHNGPAFIPNLNENTNIYPPEVSVGQTFDWRYNIAGVDIRGKAKVAEYDPPHKVVIISTGDSESKWIYTYMEEGDATRLSVEIQYDFSETAWKRLANKAIVEKITKKSAEQMLENLQIILEG